VVDSFAGSVDDGRASASFVVSVALAFVGVGAAAVPVAVVAVGILALGTAEATVAPAAAAAVATVAGVGVVAVVAVGISVVNAVAEGVAEADTLRRVAIDCTGETGRGVPEVGRSQDFSDGIDIGIDIGMADAGGVTVIGREDDGTDEERQCMTTGDLPAFQVGELLLHGALTGPRVCSESIG